MFLPLVLYSFLMFLCYPRRLLPRRAHVPHMGQRKTAQDFQVELGRVPSSNLISYLAVGKVWAKPQITSCDRPYCKGLLGFLREATEGCAFHSPVFSGAVYREDAEERLGRLLRQAGGPELDLQNLCKNPECQGAHL